jgi:hypothetical protein
MAASWSQGFNTNEQTARAAICSRFAFGVVSVLETFLASSSIPIIEKLTERSFYGGRKFSH